jgi:hypothetical protein
MAAEAVELTPKAATAVATAANAIRRMDYSLLP